MCQSESVSCSEIERAGCSCLSYNERASRKVVLLSFELDIRFKEVKEEQTLTAKVLVSCSDLNCQRLSNIIGNPTVKRV